MQEQKASNKINYSSVQKRNIYKGKQRIGMLTNGCIMLKMSKAELLWGNVVGTGEIKANTNITAELEEWSF